MQSTNRKWYNGINANAFRYCGEYYDSETGTIYLRARHYNPSNGRFTQRDSFAGKQGDPLSLNLYTYCHNNPIVRIDPSGHFSLKKAWNNYWDNWKTGAEIIKDSEFGMLVAEVGRHSLDFTMGMSNAIDENMAFGIGNKTRENLGIEAYQPFNEDYYNNIYTAGEVYSFAANTYLFVSGAANLSKPGGLLKGGMSISSFSTREAVAGISVSINMTAVGAVAQAGYGVANIMFAKNGGNSGGGMTTKEATKAAEKLGYKKQIIFLMVNLFIRMENPI